MVRGVEVTEELYDLILFCVHHVVRPTTSELYAPSMMGFLLRRILSGYW